MLANRSDNFPGEAGRASAQLPLAIVAHAIDEAITAEVVGEVIDLAVEQQLLFHGIKRASYVSRVREQGVLPLTPEAGPASYWAAGSQLFYGQLPTSDPMWSYNTVFFHYGHAYQPRGGHLMAVAITDPTRLAAKDIVPRNLKPNGEGTIAETVDPSLFGLITIGSNSMQLTQKTMFAFLLDGVRSGKLLEPGRWDIQV